MRSLRYVLIAYAKALGSYAWSWCGPKTNASTPSHSFSWGMRCCSGLISFSKKMSLAVSTSPKSPSFSGIIPIICGGTRYAASMSSRVKFLMFMNSSLAATSAIGMIGIPSFFQLAI